MMDRTHLFLRTVLRGSVPTFLGVLVTLFAAFPAIGQQPSIDVPSFKPSPGSSLPFAALAIGLGGNPATAPLSMGGLYSADEMTLAKNPVAHATLGTATLLFMGGTPATAALTELAILQGADRLGCWTLVNTGLARPIPPIFLTRFSNEPLKPLPTLADNVLEYDALSYVLLLASKNSPAAFRASANPRITFAMMFQNPNTHRGQVVHVDGDVQWINKLDTPPLLKEAGLHNLYELWIVDKTAGPTPYSVLLTELPPDLAVGKRIDVPVVLDGYFLRRRFEEREDAVQSKEWRHSLLIAGRSLTVQKLLALMVTAEGRRSVGAATLFMNGASSPSFAPLTAVSLLDQGQRAGCWTLIDTDVARPIPPETLAKIKDGKTLPASASEGQEFDALLDVLLQTWYTSPRAFEKAARKDLSFRQLFEQPAQYRGAIVHLEGRLRLLQRWDPPLMAREAGVPPMYEAAIFDDASGSNPFLVFVMDRPEGVPLNEKINETVGFDGYFFKKQRYKALDSVKATEWRDAPLLIGRSLKVRTPAATPAAPAETPTWALVTAAGVVGALTLGVIAMFILAYWLRRGDLAVQDRLHAVRTGAFVPPPDDAPPLATPVHRHRPHHPSEPEA